MSKNIFVVGRHVETFPAEYKVIGTEHVDFSDSIDKCVSEVTRLINKAGDASLVFQTAPGSLILALMQMSAKIAANEVYRDWQGSSKTDDLSPDWGNIFERSQGLGFVIAKPCSWSANFEFDRIEWFVR
jgi:hypothetical protein